MNSLLSAKYAARSEYTGASNVAQKKLQILILWKWDYLRDCVGRCLNNPLIAQHFLLGCDSYLNESSKILILL